MTWLGASLGPPCTARQPSRDCLRRQEPVPVRLPTTTPTSARTNEAGGCKTRRGTCSESRQQLRRVLCFRVFRSRSGPVQAPTQRRRGSALTCVRARRNGSDLARPNPCTHIASASIRAHTHTHTHTQLLTPRLGATESVERSGLERRS